MVRRFFGAVTNAPQLVARGRIHTTAGEEREFKRLITEHSCSGVGAYDFDTDFLIYGKEEGDYPEDKNLTIINVPMNEGRLDHTRMPRNIKDKYFVGIYAEIFTNKKVKIGNESYGIHEWLTLRNQQQPYVIGIAEFNMMAASFAVFDTLGIKNTFDVSSSIFYPKYLQFLGIDVTKYQVPGFDFAEPGDWEEGPEIWQEGANRNELNKEYHRDKNKEEERDLNQESNRYYEELRLNTDNTIDVKPDFISLFRGVKYHFINQHPYGIFNDFPYHGKIVYMGGIHVEERNILTNEEKTQSIDKKEKKSECIVLVTFGTIGNLSGTLNAIQVKSMFDQFKLYKNCIFKVRLAENLLPDNYSKNIHITSGFLPQQEAMYAGVPLICIPFSNDQFYNSSIVEHLGIGIYVKILGTGVRKEVQYGNNEFEHSEYMKYKNNKFNDDFIRAFNEIFGNE
uniref:glucuronosyltransferase n=1 Tax=Meloidogyne hapla TaxID=6305 RepID=A0A1I8BAH8_MELHA